MPDVYHPPVVFPVYLSPPPVPIEYFKLAEEMFSTSADAEEAANQGDTVYQAAITQVSLLPGGFLQAGRGNSLAALDPSTRDTTVLNFQVGVGKSTVLFDYIKQYVDDPDHHYVVLYCAPFLRLIGTIKTKLEELLSMGACAVCTEIGYESTTAQLQFASGKRVQLMTPEFLLGRGGRKFTSQSDKKSSYIRDLQKQLQASKSRVILIIDELHENTAVFDSYYLPHLLQWGLQDLIYKVFIASATFTRDSVAVIKTISCLTSRRIRVFQAERQKSLVQARLHLHICKQESGSSVYKDLLPGLARVVEEYAEVPRVVHILTAQKKQIKHLKEGAFRAAEAIQKLHPTVLDGDNKQAFNPKVSSIGTTFKTGVNLTDANTVLLIILPEVSQLPFGDLRALGIFTGILTTMVQAVARVRNGGDVHVFMPAFPSFIKTGDTDADKLCRNLLLEASGKEDSRGRMIEKTLWKQFNKLYSTQRTGYDALMRALAAKDPSASAAYQKDVGFHSWYDFVLSEYTRYVDTTLHSAGQGLSPYMLWMAVQDQFANCRLTEILVEEVTLSFVRFPASSDSVYSLVCSARDAARLKDPATVQDPLSFHESLEQVLRYLNLAAEDADPVQYQWRSSKKGSIYEGFEKERSVTHALYKSAWKLLDKEMPKKGTSFMALMDSASTPGIATNSRYEAYFFEVQQKLHTLQQVVVTEAPKSKSGAKTYFHKEIKNNIQGSLKAEKAHVALAVALENLSTFHPLYHKQILDIPQHSKRTLCKEEYLRVGEHVLTRRLGLVGKGIRTNPKGSDAAYGVGAPHYSIITADVLV